jgi:hypothetical protein
MKNSLWFKFQEMYKSDGPVLTVKYSFNFILKMVKIKRPHPIVAKQLQLSKQLSEMLNSTVSYGPFKGLRLSENSSWGATDRGAMLLGLYEREILETLERMADKEKAFINLGAGDGYYALGVLVGSLFKETYCFEQSIYGQSILETNAEKNQVANRIKVFGKADGNFFKLIPERYWQNSVILCDIEGGEFSIFTKDVFSKFGKSQIIIEIHDWFFQDAALKMQKMLENFSDTHSCSKVTTTSRDLSTFDELRGFSDTERWLICSENRERLMTWFILSPKKNLESNFKSTY